MPTDAAKSSHSTISFSQIAELGHILSTDTGKLALNKQFTNQPSGNDLVMFHQNIRGLTINKIDELSVILNNKPTHFL